MSDIVTIDVAALIQAVTDDENGTLVEVIESAVDERLSECIEEAVSDYLRYSSDISDTVNDCVSDYLSSQLSESLDDLLSQVGEGSLCSLGSRFKDAVWAVLKHHIVDWDDIFEGRPIGNGNGASTEDIQKMVAEKFNKEMKVEVTFVDKEPATVIDGPPSTSQEGYTV